MKYEVYCTCGNKLKLKTILVDCVKYETAFYVDPCQSCVEEKGELKGWLSGAEWMQRFLGGEEEE